MELGGLLWTSVLKLALPPQRPSPDAWLEHQEPFIHMAVVGRSQVLTSWRTEEVSSSVVVGRKSQSILCHLSLSIGYLTRGRWLPCVYVSTDSLPGRLLSHQRSLPVMELPEAEEACSKVNYFLLLFVFSFNEV